MSNHQTSDDSGAPEYGTERAAYWSIRGLAQHLGVRPQYLYTLKDTGKLRTELVGGRHLVPATVAAEFEERRNARIKAREQKTEEKRNGS